MAESYFTPAEATAIKLELRSVFVGMKPLGKQIDLLLWRDPEADGIGVQIGPQNVLMILASRESSIQRGQGTAFTGADGEFQKETPFDAKVGDLFTVDGIHGEITMVAPPDAIGVIRAAFVLKA